ncbi:dTDP-4-dehydrorhamnose 3,5-epimerase family protein [Mycobacterium sp. Aquia_216]|uniref:dTDP-4-dehydrorhamnose 3,5-epimerase family protein n=1 Tax=Mycobacterium sp. Aquia_216 TaxID=2991729 RepID=UPI00227CEA5E|nr:dTDP-4-dehydrorhamnose 3,5-epimerase family protein [Mycobacterium sp. Aquia_216]
MKYTPTSIAGVTIVDIEPTCDHRGFVSQSFSAPEFAEIGLIADVVQTQISFNYTRGTVRGLHRQAPPHAEAKLIRCTRGAIADVVVDVRPESPTYGKHVMVELSADNHRALFVPPYVAHGFQTLRDKTEVSCQVSGSVKPAGEEGFRFNEPEFGIDWPLPVTVISEEDATWPKLESVDGDVIVMVDVDRLLAERPTYDASAVPARIAPPRRPVHLSECATPSGARFSPDALSHRHESGSA